MIRSSTHLLVQQPFPRTHVQLEETFTNQIRFVLVELRVSFEITQETNLSTPYDQLHAAHPHVHVHNAHKCASTALMVASPMCTTSKPITTNHFMPFKTILAEPRKKLGANPSDGQRNNHVKQKVATCMTHEIRAQMQK